MDLEEIMLMTHMLVLEEFFIKSSPTEKRKKSPNQPTTAEN